jgi:acyl transferase domain-containing protein
VAAYNAPHLITIAGDSSSVTHVITHCRMQSNILASSIRSCGVAFHCATTAAFLTPMTDALLPILPQPRRRSDRWISTSNQVFLNPIPQYSNQVPHILSVKPGLFCGLKSWIQ